MALAVSLDEMPGSFITWNIQKIHALAPHFFKQGFRNHGCANGSTFIFDPDLSSEVQVFPFPEYIIFELLDCWLRCLTDSPKGRAPVIRQALEVYHHLSFGYQPATLGSFLEEEGFAVDLCGVTHRERRTPQYEVITIHATKQESR